MGQLPLLPKSLSDKLPLRTGGTSSALNLGEARAFLIANNNENYREQLQFRLDYLRENPPQKNNRHTAFQRFLCAVLKDAARVRLARSAAGPDFKIAVDANQGWDIESAITFARLVEDQDVMWFKESCHWENDRRAMRDVRFRSGIAVCAGQTEMSAAGCRDLMEIGAIHYCNFDSS